jgi:zeaxanthin glucosyltransferase
VLGLPTIKENFERNQFWRLSMSHFGILSFPATGHLHPLTILGRELVRRGHQVTVFQVADVEPLIRAAGLGFRQIGGREFLLGSLRPLDQALSRLQGMKALNFIFQRFCQNSAMVLPTPRMRSVPNGSVCPL